NRISGGAIIMSASGMCEAGRIRHHLKNNLYRPEATVLFVGYQAPGTLGQLLLAGAEAGRIHGEGGDVRATQRPPEALSGHADGPELVAWIRERLPVRLGMFLTHGEEESRAAFKQALVAAGCDGSKIFLPQLDDSFDLTAAAIHAPRERRLPPEVVGRHDWHNAYAGLVLALRRRLDALPDDRAREALLAQIQKTLGPPAARP